MIYIRLIYCAFVLLVLLLVESAMGVRDEPYKIFASAEESGVCLSLKNRRKLTACCNKNDEMQKILVTTTGISEGIFHSVGGDHILCYDTNRGRFKSMRRTNFTDISECRHQRSRRKRKRGSPKRVKRCPFSAKDKEVFKSMNNGLQCILHENLASYWYISVDPHAKYLAIRKRKVQKHKKKKNKKIKEPKDQFRRFLNIAQQDWPINDSACGR